MRRFVVPVESGGVTQEQCRLIRTRLGWSQEALAEKAALSVSAVRRFELGKGSSRGYVPGSLRRAFAAVGIRIDSATKEGIHVVEVDSDRAMVAATLQQGGEGITIAEPCRQHRHDD